MRTMWFEVAGRPGCEDVTPHLEFRVVRLSVEPVSKKAVTALAAAVADRIGCCTVHRGAGFHRIRWYQLS